MSDEIDSATIHKTQKVLGKHISKPSLTEKLLRKPPFRFLHDVTTSVIKDTGFLKGLYSETELISDNVKDRESKIAFLTKLINATKSTTGIELAVKPSKIIAGLEPAETNKLLQAIGTALDKKLDSSTYVKTNKTTSKGGKGVKTQNANEENKASSRSKLREAPSTQKVGKDKKKELSPRKNEKADEKIKKKSKREAGPKKDAIKTDVSEMVPEVSPPSKEEFVVAEDNGENEMEKNDGSDDANKQNEKNNSDTNLNDAQGTEYAIQDTSEENLPRKIGNRSDRPKSARPQSGNVVNEPSKKSSHELNNIALKNEVPVRPMSSLRPPSVRPSSARPGAPRLRPDSALPFQEAVSFGKINVIVENYNTKEIDEEETVVIQNPEADSEPQSVQTILDIPAEKGHLVEQILEQIHDDDVAEHAKSKTNVDVDQEGFRSRDATTREINQLRSTIQALTKVANPLGKLMTYLHEDVEAMHSELNIWLHMKRQIYMEIEKQKRLNEKSSEPLKIQLRNLVENIKSQEDEIGTVRSNILRNEIRISELLTK